MNKVFSDPTGQVSAKVIAHSKSSVTGKEMVTFEWEFPRLILAEVNTHKMLSKNTSSSRAIPVASILDQVCNNPAMPVRFGAANKGMQDAGEHDSTIIAGGFSFTNEEAWLEAAYDAAFWAEKYHKAGYAKQICNRLTEPFQRVKMVISGTEWNNFFWLRDHHMADPTIEALAKAAKQALEASTPVVLQPGDWHVPYYNDGVWIHSHDLEVSPVIAVDRFGHTLANALAISASCCAQASYRKLDDTIEKAKGVVARLNLQGEEPDQPVHASPLEHQCTPIKKYIEYMSATNIDSKQPSYVCVNSPYNSNTWQEGITHMDRDGTLCSGNLKGWIQHRQLVPNHVKRG